MVLKVLQYSADVAAIQAKVAAQIFCGCSFAVCNFVEDSDFSEREPALEEVLLENTDLTSVEAVKAANGFDGVVRDGKDNRWNWHRARLFKISCLSQLFESS